MCANFAAKSEDSAEVHLQDFVPVLVRELVRGVSSLNAAAVEQDVDAVAVLEDAWHESVDGGRGGQVGGVDCCFAAERFDGAFGFLVGFVALCEGC